MNEPAVRNANSVHEFAIFLIIRMMRFHIFRKARSTSSETFKSEWMTECICVCV